MKSLMPKALIAVLLALTLSACNSVDVGGLARQIVGTPAPAASAPASTARSPPSGGSGDRLLLSESAAPHSHPRRFGRDRHRARLARLLERARAWRERERHDPR